MSRTERLLVSIHVLHRPRRQVSGRKLAEEKSVSLRTTYRDIQTLIDQGALIEGERGFGNIMRPRFLLPPLMFRDEEIDANTVAGCYFPNSLDSWQLSAFR